MQDINVIIVDKEGNYFEGHSKWTKNKRKAKIYKNKITAIRHYFSNENKYKNIYVVEVEFKEISKPVKIERKDFIKCNNGDFKWAEKQGKVI